MVIAVIIGNANSIMPVLFIGSATWEKRKTGDLSTAGTTASTIIFRQNHIFVANVGDTKAILAVNNPLAGQPNQRPVKPIVLTKDHKPEHPDEAKNIISLGEWYQGVIVACIESSTTQCSVPGEPVIWPSSLGI